MSSSCATEEEDDEISSPAAVDNSPSASRLSVEFDFVERPSQDFFCPVSLELLLEPQLTSCCGHHLSLEAANRLQEEGKACPMCNGESWTAMLDKYHRRKVHQVRVRCWYRERGCVWSGEVSELEGHAGSCKKQPWECGYCGVKCELGEGEGKHWAVCDEFPVPCPNGCEVGSVERCAMEEHRSVCPLEPVACEMREFGCSVVVPRREMATHMKESEIQHLTSMTALNLCLTKQLHHDSAKMEQMIAEQRKELEEQKLEIAALRSEMVETLNVRLTKQLQHDSAKMEQIIADHSAKRNRKIEQLRQDLLEQKEVMKQLEEEHQEKLASLTQTMSSMHVELKSTTTKMLSLLEKEKAEGGSNTGTEIFIFNEYSQFKGSDMHQYSTPFYTHYQGYKVRLGIKYYSDPYNDIGASLDLLPGEYDDMLNWPVSIGVRLEVLNQAGDFRHVVKATTCTWGSGEKGEKKIQDTVMKYATLERQLDTVQFMMNDCLKFKVIVTVL